MSEKLRTEFKGTGTMKDFVANVAKTFKAINNARVIVPSGYDGVTPNIKIEDDKLVLDMEEALIFTLNNVRFVNVGTASFGSHTAEVINGQLVVTVYAYDPD